MRGIQRSSVNSITKASDAELWYFLCSVPEQKVEQTILSRWFETPSLSLWRHCNVNPHCGRCIMAWSYSTMDDGFFRFCHVPQNLAKVCCPLDSFTLSNILKSTMSLCYVTIFKMIPQITRVIWQKQISEFVRINCLLRVTAMYLSPQRCHRPYRLLLQEHSLVLAVRIYKSGWQICHSIY